MSRKKVSKKKLKALYQLLDDSCGSLDQAIMELNSGDYPKELEGELEIMSLALMDLVGIKEHIEQKL